MGTNQVMIGVHNRKRFRNTSSRKHDAIMKPTDVPNRFLIAPVDSVAFRNDDVK